MPPIHAIATEDAPSAIGTDSQAFSQAMRTADTVHPAPAAATAVAWSHGALIAADAALPRAGAPARKEA